MPAVAAITINDGQATPVAHTFDPTGPDTNGAFSYVDNSSGVALGFPRITLSKSDPRGNSSVYRVKGRFEIPVLETANGANPEGYTPGPAVAYTVRGNMEFLLPQRSDTDERKDILAYVSNFLQLALAESLIHDLEGIW